MLVGFQMQVKLAFSLCGTLSGELDEMTFPPYYGRWVMSLLPHGKGMEKKTRYTGTVVLLRFAWGPFLDRSRAV